MKKYFTFAFAFPISLSEILNPLVTIFAEKQDDGSLDFCFGIIGFAVVGNFNPKGNRNE